MSPIFLLDGTTSNKTKNGTNYKYRSTYYQVFCRNQKGLCTWDCPFDIGLSINTRKFMLQYLSTMASTIHAGQRNIGCRF